MYAGRGRRSQEKEKRFVSRRLEDTTGHQNEVANGFYPGSVWLDTRNVRKPHYDRKHNQRYRKPERPLGWCVQFHDFLPSDGQR